MATGVTPGRRGLWGTPHIRKPGDLPARDATGGRGVPRPVIGGPIGSGGPSLAHPFRLSEGNDGHDPFRLHHLQGRRTGP
jgi:hypothetical protein